MNLFYDISYIMLKNGINPDDMELEEVFYMLKKISENGERHSCPLI